MWKGTRRHLLRAIGCSAGEGEREGQLLSKDLRADGVIE